MGFLWYTLDSWLQGIFTEIHFCWASCGTFNTGNPTYLKFLEIFDVCLKYRHYHCYFCRHCLKSFVLLTIPSAMTCRTSCIFRDFNTLNNLQENQIENSLLTFLWQSFYYQYQNGLWLSFLQISIPCWK